MSAASLLEQVFTTLGVMLGVALSFLGVRTALRAARRDAVADDAERRARAAGAESDLLTDARQVYAEIVEMLREDVREVREKNEALEARIATLEAEHRITLAHLGDAREELAVARRELVTKEERIRELEKAKSDLERELQVSAARRRSDPPLEQ